MSYSLLLLAAVIAYASARFTVPVPIHYELEAQFQKQTATKMRWDPTNYLTYIAAVYAQCSHLYVGNSLQQRGRVLNNTAYTNLLTYFDASLLQNNLIIYTWDIVSDTNQDAGTVDRDIRKLSGKANGAGPLGSIPNLDANLLRSYDRFGCSVETTCQQQSSSVMTLVCVFGQTVTPRFVAGTGGNQQPAQPTQRPTTRAVPTTRARPQVRTVNGGFYETYGERSTDLYDLIVNEWTFGETPNNYLSQDVIADEQKLTTIDLCKYESNPSAFTASLLSGSFDLDAQTQLFGFAPSSMPSPQDMTASPISDTALNTIRTAISQQLGTPANPGTSIACSWALCKRMVMVGCAVWGTASGSAAEY